MANLSGIEGIGQLYAVKLEQVGVHSVEQLLDAGSNKKGRQSLAEEAGIREELIFHWVTRADLSRVKGVNTQFVNLLESAGVGTVPELALRNPMYLESRMYKVNEQKHFVRNIPTMSQVEDWVTQAKKLPRVVTF